VPKNSPQQPRRRTRTGVAVALLATATLGAVMVAAPAGAAPPSQTPAPLVGAGEPGTVDGHYVVVLDRGAGSERAAEVRAQARAHGGRIGHVYESALSGFSAALPDRAVEALRRNPAVDYVEADREMTAVATQSPATWGIDRIDQRDRPLSNSYTYTRTGAGVTAYVIDTGIRSTHADLAGRVGPGYTAIADGRGTEDCNGHGTHVAGTVGGTTWGVAKGVTLVPVRVLDCAGSGSTAGVIAGVDWVTRNSPGPSVANMSLGGGASSALDTAVANSVASGVTYAVAAGNSSLPACWFSPARTPSALTVGATTSSDARASYSNWGSCLDLFAPGSSITSAWHTSDQASNTISGTSMASPHVAGVAALYLQGAPSASASQVSSAVVAATTPGRVTSEGMGSPDRLLYSLGW
jgi:subtilisin family serine protease